MHPIGIHDGEATVVLGAQDLRALADALAYYERSAPELDAQARAYLQAMASCFHLCLVAAATGSDGHDPAAAAATARWAVAGMADPTRRKITTHLRRRGAMTFRDLRQYTHVEPPPLQAALDDLLAAGVIATGRIGRKTVYCLTDPPR
ncbi:MAG TPA: winged helix-turn-helix domain-containing protein [Thermomicrobiales bacterium]|nr:winged helix-turn-helix domain-containing protein [Thermomicrobiales bacterium]